jgi:tetratricopeptide (TPR) repeat protein
MPLSLEALLSMSPKQALLRVRNASRVPDEVCRGLADHVFSLRFKNPAEMEKWGQVADAAAEKTYDRLSAGLAHAHFGNALRVCGDNRGALAAFDRAEEMLPSAHPLLHEFRASLLMACRDNKGAVDELRKAEELRSARGDRAGLAKVLTKVGMVYDFLRQPGDAVRMLEEAVRILVERGAEARELLVIALQNLCDCLISDGQLTRARRLLDEIEEPFAATGEVNALKIMWLRGRLESYCGSDREARELFEVARVGFHEKNMRREVALTSLHLAALHHQFCRYATCVREALKVEPELESLGLDQDAEVTDLLGQIAPRSVRLEPAIWALTSLIAASRQKPTTGG